MVLLNPICRVEAALRNLPGLVLAMKGTLEGSNIVSAKNMLESGDSNLFLEKEMNKLFELLDKSRSKTIECRKNKLYVSGLFVLLKKQGVEEEYSKAIKELKTFLREVNLPYA